MTGEVVWQDPPPGTEEHIAGGRHVPVPADDISERRSSLSM
jgi:hypothetical protein